MSIDFSHPQNLMQYKNYAIAKEGQIVFFFDFKNYNEEIHTIRVFKNAQLLQSNEYDVNIIDGSGITIILQLACTVQDIIHLDVFMPLSRFNDYSICISHDFIINCAANLSTYDFKYPDYSEVTCKLQIIHSRLGFIPKDKYSIIGDKIKFTNVKFLANDKLYVKIIQDGGILLQ